MDKAKSALIFDNFWVQDIIFEKNPGYVKTDEKPSLDVKFSVTQDENIDQIFYPCAWYLRCTYFVIY
ncbi:Hypothetical protein DEACI_0184 [Acididesulfobacillus acetoxydans]|uniref:Uncharacterized protein n=1 Tax=Acididesulfobacillus acetoxydans TaxID=1561005 RepID=A0A8S0W1M6_9FIRM|nr:Hypothetical protein DEACI_0184 [Acididesulfobacillus acetoxydans]CEJ07753.1 Hypothetical protein DEACI_2219 [Acididesulfobacillus acetoxydans]